MRLAVPTGASPGIGFRLRREVDVTWRMLADNLPIEILPPMAFALGAGLRAQLPAHQIAGKVGQAMVLFVLYAYIFDAANQAKGADEDRINKPYRPVPAGLITPAGALCRFWIAMPLYSLLGWALGVLEWVLLWQAIVVFLNLIRSPRYYLWCKTPCCLGGALVQLSAAWQIVSPIDATIVVWMAVIVVPTGLALVFEDVRDMAGDRAIGHRTPALILGERPIRIWFAALMAAIPVLQHFLLHIPTGAAPWRIALVGLIIASCCWTAAVRALLLRHTRADRHTYQLMAAAYIISVLAAPILWAQRVNGRTRAPQRAST